MKTVNCILLVDDNEHDNFFHSIVIKEAGAARQIKTAISGFKALEYLEDTKKDPEQYPVPDLIFLDINMPGINGFEFLEKARELKLIDENKSFVVVMLTSSMNPNDENNAKKNFANEIKEFRNKPLTAEMLEEITEHFF